MNAIKSTIRNALYWLGFFGLLHRLRNRRTLTTFMFHRVLPTNSIEFVNAEREFTFTIDGFGQCLDFIQEYYHVITLQDLQRARANNTPLPNRAALITFDDGWRDTLVHANPVLIERNLPAVLFVASEVPLLQSARWWQDALVSVLADEAATVRLMQGVRRLVSVNLPSQRLSRPELNALLSELPEASRMALLADATALVEMPRQMLNAAELQLLQGGNFELGAHGHTHAPLTALPHATKEVADSMAWLKSTSAMPLAMSFPHGAYSPDLVDAAHEAGFDYVFTSTPELQPTDSNLHAAVTFGRIHIPENQWTCERGEISFPLLATFLFFRPKAGLA